MEFHETHIGINPEGERYRIGESMGWESSNCQTFGSLYREIMKWGLPCPDTGVMRRPRCTGRMWRESKSGDSRHVGWVFLFANPDGYKREIWLEARA